LEGRQRGQVIGRGHARLERVHGEAVRSELPASRDKPGGGLDATTRDDPEAHRSALHAEECHPAHDVRGDSVGRDRQEAAQVVGILGARRRQRHGARSVVVKPEVVPGAVEDATAEEVPHAGLERGRARVRRVEAITAGVEPIL
jgi:hypothetical protein